MGSVREDGDLKTKVNEPTFRFDGSASPLLYLGSAPFGTSPGAAAWQIKRFNVASGVICQFADGNADFDNVWDNRASLSYS